MASEIIYTFSWNLNGLVSHGRFDNLFSVLELHKFPHIVYLQETHAFSKNHIDNWKKQLPLYNCYFNLGSYKSCGTAVLVLKSLPFTLYHEIQDTSEGRFSILKGRLFEDLVTLASVYAPVEIKDQPAFFERLFSTNLEGIKLIMGDFNSVPNLAMDRINTNKAINHSLKDFIKFTNTVDAWRHKNPTKLDFTCRAISRIDLVLVSDIFCNQIVECQIGGSYTSDHRTLVTKFKFSNAVWGKDFRKIRSSTIKLPKYSDVFYKVWNECMLKFHQEIYSKLLNKTFIGDMGTAALIWERDKSCTHPIFLDNLTLDGEWWDNFKTRLFHESWKFQKLNHDENINEFHRLQKQFFRLPQGTDERTSVENKLTDLMNTITANITLQKAKVKRLYHERYSSAFLRIAAQARKEKTLLKVTNFHDEVITDRTEIQGYLMTRYIDLYKHVKLDNRFLDYFTHYTPKLSRKEKTSPYTVQEASRYIGLMTGNTSPGLDGIPGQFYKSYFHVFGTFYTKMVNNCLETGSLPKSWDTTVMKVIPKNTEEAPSFDFLRPLQVPNEDSKICAGMIEHRMSKVSSDVININQTGGVPNRFIQTSTFLIHLLINFYSDTKRGGYVVSLDNVKAYDKMIREYLYIVLTNMGFDPITINHIKLLYKKTCTRLIVNGFLSAPFELLSGVRQGCPLSALLYTILMEPLARSILEDPIFFKHGFLLPHDLEVKILQHIDDMTFFARNTSAFNDIMDVVYKYTGLSGAQVSERKSFAIKLNKPDGPRDREVSKIANITILKPGEFRKILGFYFGQDVKEYIIKNWEVGYKKCKDELVKWQTKLLETDQIVTITGKAVIVNAMIVSKLVYLMQTLQYDSHAMLDINRKISKFLWNDVVQCKLDVLAVSRDHGGIGIVPMSQKAKSMRLSHIQRYLKRDDENWYSNLTPTDVILIFYMDRAVRQLIPDLPIVNLSNRWIFAGYIHPGEEPFPVRVPNIFDIFYHDIKRALEIFGSTEEILRANSRIFLDHLMRRKAISIRRKRPDGVYIYKYGFSAVTEKYIWDLINCPTLDRSVVSFNYRLAHDCLPTMAKIHHNRSGKTGPKPDPWCKYCKYVLPQHLNRPQTVKHIFIECPIAVATWHIINQKLLTAGCRPFDIDESLVYFRLGLDKAESHVASEILWNLWKVCAHNNHNVDAHSSNKSKTHIQVLCNVNTYLMKNSKLDKIIITNDKRYKARWSKLNQLIAALNT